MTEQQFTTWLDAYGRAYTTQDPEAAASLFTENATYQWGPFGELLCGPTEIHRRWAEWANPSEQDLRFEYEILVVTDEIGIARWMASSRFPSDESWSATTASLPCASMTTCAAASFASGGTRRRNGSPSPVF